jgi:hypothetical protein
MTTTVRVYAKRSTFEDISLLLNNLRPADKNELLAGGYRPHEWFNVLAYGVQQSYCMTGFTPEGEVACIGGVADNPTDITVNDRKHIYFPVWLIGSSHVEKYRYDFLRRVKVYIQEIEKRSGGAPIGNYVHSRNILHIKWLEWAGFNRLTTAVNQRTDEVFHFYKK